MSRLVIPLNERHLRQFLPNGERPLLALGPGPPNDPTHETELIGHRIPATHRVGTNARLGGLPHHYLLEPLAA
jgi:hypothetical protein